MMTMIISADLNLAGTTLEQIFKEENNRERVKEGYYKLIIDGRPGHAKVLLLWRSGNILGL